MNDTNIIVEKYIIFQPPDNEEVQDAVKSWLSEAGGNLPLEEIERKFNEVFHFYYPQIYTAEQMDTKELVSWKKFSFRLEDGIVYQK